MRQREDSIGSYDSIEKIMGLIRSSLIEDSAVKRNAEQEELATMDLGTVNNYEVQDEAIFRKHINQSSIHDQEEDKDEDDNPFKNAEEEKKQERKRSAEKLAKNTFKWFEERYQDFQKMQSEREVSDDNDQSKKKT